MSAVVLCLPLVVSMGSNLVRPCHMDVIISMSITLCDLKYSDNDSYVRNTFDRCVVHAICNQQGHMSALSWNEPTYCYLGPVKGLLMYLSSTH